VQTFENRSQQCRMSDFTKPSSSPCYWGCLLKDHLVLMVVVILLFLSRTMVEQVLDHNNLCRKHRSTACSKALSNCTKIKEWIIVIRLERQYTQSESLLTKLQCVLWNNLYSSAKTYFQASCVDFNHSELAILWNEQKSHWVQPNCNHVNRLKWKCTKADIISENEKK
jgi:hypothetical protein